jgi:hypothetical protein
MKPQLKLNKHPTSPNVPKQNSVLANKQSDTIEDFSSELTVHAYIQKYRAKPQNPDADDLRQDSLA